MTDFRKSRPYPALEKYIKTGKGNKKQVIREIKHLLQSYECSVAAQESTQRWVNAYSEPISPNPHADPTWYQYDLGRKHVLAHMRTAMEFFSLQGRIQRELGK